MKQEVDSCAKATDVDDIAQELSEQLGEIMSLMMEKGQDIGMLKKQQTFKRGNRVASVSEKSKINTIVENVERNDATLRKVTAELRKFKTDEILAKLAQIEKVQSEKADRTELSLPLNDVKQSLTTFGKQIEKEQQRTDEKLQQYENWLQKVRDNARELEQKAGANETSIENLKEQLMKQRRNMASNRNRTGVNDS